ncbi:MULTISPECIES: hypothetical protein [unclassified Bradyrhizobium]|uniref:hypothetical protein n=1 Tax=unclassified Bradyrhizobium TaxID=2631580 RepID=UPI0028EA8E97|nr:MULTISPECIES: hypothetical protein [unclassified Bradyrhizobium]
MHDFWKKENYFFLAATSCDIGLIRRANFDLHPWHVSRAALGEFDGCAQDRR